MESGFTSGKKENKLGLRASETTELIFDNLETSNLFFLLGSNTPLTQSMHPYLKLFLG